MMETNCPCCPNHCPADALRCGRGRAHFAQNGAETREEHAHHEGGAHHGQPMQEMDPAILPRASKIYFDSKEAVLSESGDILIPLEEGIITEEDFTGDLGMVLKGELVGRENDEEIIVFETVGVAVQDLVAAKKIYEKAVEANVETEWK